ncbi:MAG: glycosyltransferase family 2 protein [Planctomycetes bacterium]|nr:glycosyltransferase family 2 protein [Planctomycetota bacterium]
MEMEWSTRDPSAPPAEWPLFGQVVRQLVPLRLELLEDCLNRQRQTGVRLGEILQRRDLLTRDQVAQVLQLQAREAAGAWRATLASWAFPYPTFLSLCLPAYNEEANIEDTLDAACAVLPEFVQQHEILVVNDGSTDHTGIRVNRYAEREPHVRALHHPHNRGYGAALSTALHAARGDHVAFMDSDGQFNLLDLPRLLVPLDRYEIVAGYRRHRADSWQRKVNAWAWNQLIRVVLGVHVRDLDCAFKVFSRGVVDRLQLQAAGAGINAEILAQCVRRGLAICEVPVHHYPRCHGAPTGAALRVIVKAFRELPWMVRYRFRFSSPNPPASPPASADPCPGAGLTSQGNRSEPCSGK